MRPIEWHDGVEVSKMHFSVLMSVYHRENPEHFDHALESILIKQTLPPTEFVLICDGPLSEALDSVIKKYTDMFPSTLTVYRLDSNVGLGKALDFGLKKCSNRYVARADSDDICVPHRFEKQLRFLACNPDIAVLGSDIDEFDSDVRRPSRYKKMPADHVQIRRMARFRNPVNHMTAVFDREAVLSVGSYEHLPFVEDYFLWVRLLAHGYRFANINEALVHARVGNGTIIRRGNPQHISSWRLINRYMHSNELISTLEYYRNMFWVRVFIYMPNWMKTLAFQRVLRKPKLL